MTILTSKKFPINCIIAVWVIYPTSSKKSQVCLQLRTRDWRICLPIMFNYNKALHG